MELSVCNVEICKNAYYYESRYRLGYVHAVLKTKYIF